MANTIEVKVPDIGDYSDVPVIEVLVAVGDTVKKDQGLVTLESDKATLEVPSSADGVVREIKVKVGDKLSEGGDPKSQVCGWLKDRFGLSWQITPSELPELMSDPATTGRVMKAVLNMKKIDLAELRRAAKA